MGLWVSLRIYEHMYQHGQCLCTRLWLWEWVEASSGLGMSCQLGCHANMVGDPGTVVVVLRPEWKPTSCSFSPAPSGPSLLSLHLSLSLYCRPPSWDAKRSSVLEWTSGSQPLCLWDLHSLTVWTGHKVSWFWANFHLSESHCFTWRVFLIDQGIDSL